jgi:D-alanyl-D-alanine carboxypeptidase/D-alanyl-D-alanine-endopeptidase (penicillin-binding protein 4)
LAIIVTLFTCLLPPAGNAQTHQAIRQFVNHRSMKGASLSLMIRDLNSGDTLYSYDAGRELTPASVLKLVTTAAALELLGSDYRFATTLEYDGAIDGADLTGNLYIRGSGDPTLGSSHFAPNRSSYTPDRNTFAPRWIAALEEKGIRRIRGSVIADESIFDTEGVSPKWLYEDLGSYYAAGSYGLSVFDNTYRLLLTTGPAGQKPAIVSCQPQVRSLRFHNYLTSAPVATDSAYIVGAPFSADRYLYGVLPANRKQVQLRGDIPDPPLFLAQYMHDRLRQAGITVEGQAASFRLLEEEGNSPRTKRRTLATTYSPALRSIVRITNERSHNLYADALLKTIGVTYTPQPARGEAVSTAGRGVRAVRSHWQSKGLDVSSLRMFDGSGLAAASKTTASFICELLVYMASGSDESDAFIASLPRAGQEGSVSSFLRNTHLEGKALIKSGGMSSVRAYAGYIAKGNRQYALAIIVNNYSSPATEITGEIEALLLTLF